MVVRPKHVVVVEVVVVVVVVVIVVVVVVVVVVVETIEKEISHFRSHRRNRIQTPKIKTYGERL
jgi:hypothetical protein